MNIWLLEPHWLQPIRVIYHATKQKYMKTDLKQKKSCELSINQNCWIFNTETFWIFNTVKRGISIYCIALKLEYSRWIEQPSKFPCGETPSGAVCMEEPDLFSAEPCRFACSTFEPDLLHGARVWSFFPSFTTVHYTMLKLQYSRWTE